MVVLNKPHIGEACMRSAVGGHDIPGPETVETFVSEVLGIAESRALKVLSQSMPDIDARGTVSGKMLRARLAGRLCTGDWSPVDHNTLQVACAATELVHAASLCHDDVVDNSLVRRSLPTLWRVVGTSGAILIGDLLLCEAMTMLMETEDGRLCSGFVAKTTEMVKAEAMQELFWRGKQPDAETCLQLARGKTGPLFAFAAGVCAGNDDTLCGLLEEAGYRIGTAYQLGDDLADVLGTECTAGKTLGTDLARGKCTLPQITGDGERTATESISELCSSAVELLDDYPKPREGLRDFLLDDFQPVLEQTLGIETGIAV